MTQAADVNDQLQRASEVQHKYADRLMSLPHVIGVAIGYVMERGERKPEIGLVVMVDEKLPEAQLSPDAIVPHEIEGVRVDVQEQGAFFAH